MKATKLIAVGAVALTSAVFAEGLTSGVVGYKQHGLRDGITLVSPCFKDVVGEGVDLTKLVPGGEYASGQVIVSELDNVGHNVADYVFYKNRTTGVWGWKGDEGDIAEGDVVFEQGQGISVDGDTGLSVTSAGAVSTDDIVIKLRNGVTFTGNCTAVNLDLIDIIPGGEYASGEIIVSVIDNVGHNVADYVFYKNRTTGVWGWKGDDGDIVRGDVVFAPGEGFSVDGSDGLTITIPGPDID